MSVSSSIRLGSGGGGGGTATGFLTATGALAIDTLAAGAAKTGALVVATGGTTAVGVMAALDVVADTATLAVLTTAVGVTTARGMVGGGAVIFGLAATCTPGTTGILPALAGVVATAAGAGDTPAILFKSPIFFVSSATRLVASLACFSLAILSSAAALP